MELKLKPCPFCGGKSYIERMHRNSRIYTVGCNTKGCIARVGHIFFGFVDKRKVADAWNKREDDKWS